MKSQLLESPVSLPVGADQGRGSPFPELNLKVHGEAAGLGEGKGGVGLPGEQGEEGAAENGKKSRAQESGCGLGLLSPFASLIDTFQLFLPISLTFEMLFFFSSSER